MPNTKNKIIADHGEWLEVDISTKKHPTTSMYLDKDVWLNMPDRRISPQICGCHNYIKAIYNTSNKRRSVHHAVLPKKVGYQIDHIRHGTVDFIDNRRSNLRYATPSQNMMNMGLKSTNKSGIVGVHWVARDEKWSAKIRANGKTLHLGNYDNIDFAIGARRQAEIKYQGEYRYN